MKEIKEIVRKRFKWKYISFLYRLAWLKLFSRACIKTGSWTVAIEKGCRMVADKSSRIEIGSKAYLKQNTFVEAHDGGRVVIGRNFFSNRNATIVARSSIEIGDDCMLGEAVSIYDHNYRHDEKDKSFREQGYVSKPIKIGNNVWIGSKAFIGPGVTIGDGAIIGANAVIVKNVPAHSTAYSMMKLVLKERDAVRKE